MGAGYGREAEGGGYIGLDVKIAHRVLFGSALANSARDGSGLEAGPGVIRQPAGFAGELPDEHLLPRERIENHIEIAQLASGNCGVKERVFMVGAEQVLDEAGGEAA